MIILSYTVNLLVLVPLLIAFASQPNTVDTVFGPNTDARKILVCLYATIALASLLGLTLIGFGDIQAALSVGVTLFALQIIYKAMTVPIVGWDSPVVKTNVLVIAIHSATLINIWISRS